MHKTTVLLLTMGLWPPLAGAVYFLGSLWRVPFMVVLSFALLAAPALYLLVARVAGRDVPPSLSKKSATLLVAGIALLAGACALLARRYGDWDAALIWNLHARHLATPGGWRAIFEPGASGNAAYPYGLSGAVAFGWRTLGNFTPVVPGALAMLATVGIPVVGYLQAGARNLVIGTLVLAFFGLHRYYLALGLDQYADIQIAWLMLLAAVCLHRFKETSRKGYVGLAGALLGAMCWTKFDGVMLSACILLWHLATIFKRKAALTLLLGLLPFAAVLAIFNLSGAPSPPLSSGWKTAIIHLQDPTRYTTIAAAYCHEATGVHLPLFAMLLGYPLLCWRAKQRISPMYGVLCTAAVGYGAVYLLLVTTDLVWNLRFSLPRLLLHLYPTLVFITAIRAEILLSARRPGTASQI